MNKQPELHDVINRFRDRPGELDIVIHNREDGIESEGMERWEEYSLELLVQGRAAIEKRRKADIRSGLLRILAAWAVIFSQVYFAVLGETPGKWEDLVPAFGQAIVFMALMTPVLLFNWIFYGGEDGTYLDYRQARLASAWRKTGLVAVLITVINLLIIFVGA